jgi:hypothetical protein
MHGAKTVRTVVTASVILLLLAAGLDRAAAEWRSSSRVHCATTCEPFGGAVSSGNFGDTRFSYYVCRTNVNDEGRRAGYNLQDHGQGEHKCVVGYGGKEFSTFEFSCLCHK